MLETTKISKKKNLDITPIIILISITSFLLFISIYIFKIFTPLNPESIIDTCPFSSKFAVDGLLDTNCGGRGRAIGGVCQVRASRITMDEDMQYVWEIL